MNTILLLLAMTGSTQGEAEAQDRPKWSAGAGIGGTLGVVTSGAALGSLGALLETPGPAVNVFIERSLSSHWSLILQGRGSYASDRPEPTDTPAGGAKTSLRHGNASLTTGARWTPAPDALVVVSPALLVGVHITESELVGGPEIPTSATRGWAFLLGVRIDSRAGACL
jgi:hypothetical protein